MPTVCKDEKAAPEYLRNRKQKIEGSISWIYLDSYHIQALHIFQPINAVLAKQRVILDIRIKIA